MCLFPSSLLAGFRRAGSGGECPYPSSGPVDRPEQSWACLSYRRDVSRLRSRLCARRTNLTPSDRPRQGRRQGSVLTPTRMRTHATAHSSLAQAGGQYGGVRGPVRGCGAGRARSLSRRRVRAQRRRWLRWPGLHSPGPSFPPNTKFRNCRRRQCVLTCCVR